MSLVSSVITSVRYDINDENSARFSDAAILERVKIAVRRVNRIIQRVGLQFAKTYADIPTVASQAYVAMPADLDVPLGLLISSTRDELTLCTERDWELLGNSQAANKYYLLDYVNSRILLKGTPTSVVTLRFWYFPTVDPSAYTTASTMPWGGRMDDIIAQYVGIRLNNTDEMDVETEKTLLSDMETQLIEAYRPNSALKVEGDGWLPE